MRGGSGDVEPLVDAREVFQRLEVGNPRAQVLYLADLAVIELRAFAFQLF